MFHLGVVGTPLLLLKCFCSFLRDRTARVKVGSVIGPSFPLNAGTPQGAGPSAALFNLCVSKAPTPKTIHQYWSSYADDTSQLVCTIQKTASNDLHGIDVSKAVEVLNKFEHKEGLISEPLKSWIMPIGNIKPPYVLADNHEYTMPPNCVGKLLGHQFRRSNMVGMRRPERPLVPCGDLRELKPVPRFMPLRPSYFPTSPILSSHCTLQLKPRCLSCRLCKMMLYVLPLIPSGLTMCPAKPFIMTLGASSNPSIRSYTTEQKKCGIRSVKVLLVILTSITC